MYHIHATCFAPNLALDNATSSHNHLSMYVLSKVALQVINKFAIANAPVDIKSISECIVNISIARIVLNTVMNGFFTWTTDISNLVIT